MLISLKGFKEKKKRFKQKKCERGIKSMQSGETFIQIRNVVLEITENAFVT